MKRFAMAALAAGLALFTMVPAQAGPRDTIVKTTTAGSVDLSARRHHYRTARHAKRSKKRVRIAVIVGNDVYEGTYGGPGSTGSYERTDGGRYRRGQERAQRIINRIDSRGMAYTSNDDSSRSATYEGGKPSYCHYVGPWCGCFARFEAGITHGVSAKAFDVAFTWKRLRHTGAQVGSYAVMTWSHVGKVVGFDGSGNPIVRSGNHNHRIATAVYPKNRVSAYVDASSYDPNTNYFGARPGKHRRGHHRTRYASR